MVDHMDEAAKYGSPMYCLLENALQVETLESDESDVESATEDTPTKEPGELQS